MLISPTQVKRQSVAGEDGKVGVGDVLDEIDATPTFGVAPESAAALVRRCARRPVQLGVVKAEGRGGGAIGSQRGGWRSRGSGGCGRVFPPLLPLLKEAGIEVNKLEAEWAKNRRYYTGKYSKSLCG